ncbi:MAG: hypothetical protein DSY50_01855 [Desulfobulbus sp.]|nr:MAG: hypothetical protein DSY50_01855 [Desulfobulbus sp.]
MFIEKGTRFIFCWRYPWSSARFHSGTVASAPLIQKHLILPEATGWRAVLSVDNKLYGMLEEKNRTGRPFDTDTFYSTGEK